MFQKEDPLCIITGPCVIESESHTMHCAEKLVRIFENKPLKLVFKASYDKANRSSIHSFRGPGLEKGLAILEKVKKTFSLPVTSDVHNPEEVNAAKEVLDIIQIPAFLCRQTDLLLAAGKTGKWVNVKKGQFLSPWEMQNVIDKILSTNNEKIILTERGTMFGYNNLVSDMRSIIYMKQMGKPVCFDASHSVQLPGSFGTSSGGNRDFILPLTKSAIALGIQALFIESHPEPEKALSDSASVFSLNELEGLLEKIVPLHALCKE